MRKVCASDRLSLPEMPAHTAKSDRVVQFSGRIELFTNGMPDTSFIDLSTGSSHPVFVHSWIDQQRSEVSQVYFSGGSQGYFQVAHKYRDGDNDLLKMQITMLFKDPETRNRRTVPLCTSAAFVSRMLDGEADSFQSLDEFVQGDCTRVSMQIVNREDLSSSPLRLVSSSLHRIPELNSVVTRVSKSIAANVQMNKTVFPPGTESMQDGVSRYGPVMSSALPYECW